MRPKSRIARPPGEQVQESQDAEDRQNPPNGCSWAVLRAGVGGHQPGTAEGKQHRHQDRCAADPVPEDQ